MEPNAISVSHRGVNRAINLIQQDPGAPLDLDEIADAACLSKFHFSRLFRSVMGETPVSFLWRTRLEHSALSFDYGGFHSVTETALDYGFASPEAFSRAFTRAIGLTPRRFAAQADQFAPRIAPQVQAQTQSHGGLRLGAVAPAADAKVRIAFLPDMPVAFLRRRGPYNYYGSRRSGISDIFTTVIRRARAHGIMAPGCMALGIGYNSPRLTRPESCLYDICVTTEGYHPGIRDLDQQVIKGGRFAILNVRCPTYLIAEYWNWLTYDWLPKSGETAGIGPSIERYEISGMPSPLDPGRTEICLRLTG